MKRERDNRRIQKAIDELIKIQDDGYGNIEIDETIDILRTLENKNSED